MSVWAVAEAWPGDETAATLVQLLAAYGVTLTLVSTVILLFKAKPNEEPTGFDRWLERESERRDGVWGVLDDPDDGG